MNDIKKIPQYDPVNDTSNTFYGEDLIEDPQIVDNIVNKETVDISDEQQLQELIDEANRQALEDL